MIATATALLECGPVFCGSLAVALGVALNAGIMLLMLLADGQAAQAAPAPAVQSSQLIAAFEDYVAAKGDRLVWSAKLEAGGDGGRGNQPLECLLRTA